MQKKQKRTIYLLLFIILFYQLFVSKQKTRQLILKNVIYGIMFFILIIFYLSLNEFINLELTVKERFDIFEMSRFSSAGIHFKLIKFP